MVRQTLADTPALAAIAGSLLFAVAVALVAFAWASEPGTTEAATDGAAMSLRVPVSQTTDCPGGPVAGEVCVLGDQKFDVIVVADAIPAPGYILAWAFIDYDDQGVVNKDNTQALWPDHEPITFLTFDHPPSHVAQAGAITGLVPPQPASFHKGDLFSFSLTCTQDSSTSDIELIPDSRPILEPLTIFTEFGTGARISPEVSGITVNCVPRPPAMILRVDSSETVDCPGGPVAGKVCVVQGQKFDVIVVADAIPLTNGYILAQAWVDYGNTGLIHNPVPMAIWPDLEAATYLTIHDVANTGMQAGGLTGLGPPHPASFYKGDLFAFSLTCTVAQSSHKLNIIPVPLAPAGTSGALFHEAGADGQDYIPTVTGIQVDCVPQPTPEPVGGISHDVELRALPLETSGPSGPSIGVLAGIAAALGFGAMLVAGAALYARRRFRRA